MLLLSPLRLSIGPHRLRRCWPLAASARNIASSATTCRKVTQMLPSTPSQLSIRMIFDHRGLMTSPPTLATPVRSRGGTGRKIVVGLIGSSALVVLVAVGGTVAYGKYFDPELRHRIEKNVANGSGLLSPLPISFSDWILDRLFGQKDGTEAIGQNPQSQQQQQPLQLSTKEKTMQTSLLQKKLDRDSAAAAAAVAANKKESATQPSTEIKLRSDKQDQDPNAKKDASVAVATSIRVAMEKPETVDIQQSKDVKSVGLNVPSSDSKRTVENNALERRIKDSVRDVEPIVSSAIDAYEQATRHLRSNAGEKTASLAAAETKALEARAAIQKVKLILDRGRKSKLAASNQALIEAEEVINGSIYKLQKAEAEATLAGSQANVLDDYKKLADEGQQKVLAEIKAGEKGQLSVSEIESHVQVLRQQIITQQKGEEFRVQKALNTQREEYEKLIIRRVNIELQRQQRELEINYHKKLAEKHDEYEQEVHQQLRRQAAAHTDHLHDVLQAQQEKLVADYGRRLEDLVLQARHNFQAELSGSLGRLEGINAALKGRAELDEARRQAQRLWIACQALRHSIRFGNARANSWEEQRKPLSPIVSSIQSATGNNDKFVSAILSSIPETALTEGVFTESALRDRFLRVTDACRKVALVGDQGGSLFRYALSYVRAMILFNIGGSYGGSSVTATSEEEELNDKPSIDVDNLDAFEILERAHRCLDRGNMELAVRYMNQLKGAPRALARDWLVEARFTLEVSQVVDALLARAAATEVHSANAQ